MTHTIPFNHLTDGNITDAIFHTYGDSIGLGWFFSIFMIITIGIAYIRTQNIVYPAVITLIFCGVGWAYLPPEVDGVLGLFVVFALAGLLYKAFSPRGS